MTLKEIITYFLTSYDIKNSYGIKARKHISTSYKLSKGRFATLALETRLLLLLVQMINAECCFSSTTVTSVIFVVSIPRDIRLQIFERLRLSHSVLLYLCILIRISDLKSLLVLYTEKQHTPSSPIILPVKGCNDFCWSEKYFYMQ